MNSKNIDYFFELYQQSKIPRIFSSVSTKPDERTIINPEFDAKVFEKKKEIYSVFFIPDYLKPATKLNDIKIRKVNQFFKGYAVFLNESKTADAYLKTRFRSNAKAIRRRVRRLETSFDISYTMFYGSITQNNYNALMNTLHTMLVRRFDQRNDTSQTLIRWQHYKNMYFTLINEKKASLFLIKSNNEPIVISLGHHYENRLFSAISSYDIDYGKFSLGNVEIYKKLEWCLDNDHVSYEMGMGDLSYKREWCNHIYNFEHQIIYSTSNLSSMMKGNLIYLKIRGKEWFYKIAYNRYKNFKAKRKPQNVPVLQYKINEIQNREKNYDYPIIDFNTKSYEFLREITFDFLYTTQDHVSKVKVLKISENNFMILGKDKCQMINLL